ncbi:hypothetical protein [Xanthomonas phaseoli]|uniref:hypothetical protein n=1 Tax=Xanthomonas phaseoli TaxID=1985254 RepID=UPI001300CD54|nr:hypothetical protein [Xanthomonas phaseoli]MBO9908584.1 hypothetical protein [Xanthomonas phaseoli pv. dieffenbachiae]
MNQSQGREGLEEGRREYGRRLSPQEYDLQTISLYEGQAPIPSRDDLEKIRRAELDLTVDFTLGVGFPRDKRDELWCTQRKLARSSIARLVFGIFASPFAPSRYLVKSQVRAFSKILNRREVCDFLGLSDKDFEDLM